MIAGCALAANAKLATDNTEDFMIFVEAGLELVAV